LKHIRAVSSTELRVAIAAIISGEAP
jgi:hypothetical protein